MYFVIKVTPRKLYSKLGHYFVNDLSWIPLILSNKLKEKHKIN